MVAKQLGSNWRPLDRQPGALPMAPPRDIIVVVVNLVLFVAVAAPGSYI